MYPTHSRPCVSGVQSPGDEPENSPTDTAFFRRMLVWINLPSTFDFIRNLLVSDTVHLSRGGHSVPLDCSACDEHEGLQKSQWIGIHKR